MGINQQRLVASGGQIGQDEAARLDNLTNKSAYERETVVHFLPRASLAHQCSPC
jgi:hypothetical protein